MAQYLLSVHHDYDASPPPDAQVEEIFAAVAAFNDEITAAGQLVFGGGLEPPHTATVAAIRDGAPVVSDGPYIESKEVLGGFWVVEAADLDAALAIAFRATAACRAPVEVRPFEADG